MTTPVGISLQLRCEDPAEYDSILASVKELSLLSVEVALAPGMPEWVDGDRFVIAVVAEYQQSKSKPVLIDMLDQLEQLALSLETVVPETVRATLSAPSKDAAIVGEYADFLDAKVDHLMIRTLSLQEQLDETAQDLADGLQACQQATQRCESVYTALEQQGAAYFSGMFQALAKSVEDITGNNPLEGYEAQFTIH
uniref:Uncharacterized protein n=1 Tax=Pseudomonas phage Cygsa01 TaxID=3138529 RepID=A0AAU6W3L7_9VIRU